MVEAFNKPDTNTGQALAWMPEKLWGAIESRIAWLLLHKYEKQLSQGGIVYAEIAELPTVEGEENLGGLFYRYITFTNGEFHLHFPYSTDIIEEIKQAIPATYRRFSWRDAKNNVSEVALLSHRAKTTRSQGAAFWQDDLRLETIIPACV